ncbi:MAG: toprim domain-containing protein, partial [Desulfobacterales bacterium]|nr:toprim domain-containing protein [Desulfobacterales bacterium]
MDVIAAHDNYFSNVIASMGTSITDKHVSILKKITNNIVLALDADIAGEEAALRGIIFENSLGAEVKVTVLPQGKDPDEVIRESKESWQKLIDDAIPVMDYTFSRVTAELDLNTARDKSLAVEKLEPIISQMKDLIRESHYFQKLARLADINPNQLQIIFKNKAVERNHSKSFAKENTIAAAPSHNLLTSNPPEEYCLVLLLQHPELKTLSSSIMPEYFENSENREIFNAYLSTENISSIKETLDDFIREHLDGLVAKCLPPDRIEEKFSDCVLRLREEFLRRLERKREAVFASEALSGGSGAELNKLEEQGTEGSSQLRDIFIQRSRGSQKQRRNG